MMRIVTVIICSAIVIVIVAIIFFMLPANRVYYSGLLNNMATSTVATTTPATTTPEFVVTHAEKPSAVKGMYFTSWAAGTPSFRKHMFDLLGGSTILNSVVIDVKDYSGRIGFEVNDPELVKIGSVEKRIPNIKEFIGSLHDKGVYVIGRVAVFQDPFIVKVKPEWAVHDARTGKLWRDSGGAYWADPSNKAVWQYNVAIAKEAYSVGFDEINFDYVRFPSDGAVTSARYSDLASTTKAKVIKEFFSYLHDELSAASTSIPISVDLFGQTTSDTGDMGIGQHLEDAMPYFDFIDPMVYPSHYINGFIGYAKPAAHPYEVVKYAMDQAVTRAVAASSSPSLMRPWLQAFDLGAIYTADMIRAEIKATYDAGLTEWILWNAGCIYNKSAFLIDPKPTEVTAKSTVASSTKP